jgi:NTE family protein
LTEKELLMSDIGPADRHLSPERASGSTGVAVVLAGAGSRGAYEAGVLSVLLPALEAQGMRPTIFMGSSAGAINAAAFGSMSHLSADAAGKQATGIWREIGPGDVFRPPARATVAAIGRWAVRAGRPRRRAAGLLDTTPLTATMARMIDWDRLHDNVRENRVKAVGVTGTACTTHRTSVFVECSPGTAVPECDAGRSIDYFGTALDTHHIVASSSMPAIFPAVGIESPPEARDWYLDGGLRLNTPIKPALSLGAERVVIIATAPALPPAPATLGRSSSPGPTPGTDAPGVAYGGAALLHTLLVDRMIEDLHTLAKKNARAQESLRQGRAAEHGVIPWIFAGPSHGGGGDLGRLVTETFQHAGGPGGMLRAKIAKVLGHDPNRGEVMSYLFFEPEFISGAIELGQTDARRCLDAAGVPIWQVTAA